MASDVTVIIVNWNGAHLLDRCLNAIRAQTYRSCAVVLVDNASTDGSVELLQRNYPDVTVIHNNTNVGYAAANNIGIEANQSKYVATLNNDTEAEPAWLGELVRTMEVNPEAGMCASKILSMEHPDLIDSAGICVDRAGIAWDRRGGERDEDHETAPEEVFGPCAAAAIYRRSMLRQIGAFDGDFFAYLEDVDLAWRAQLSGWRCLYVPTARVYHIQSATSGEGSCFKNYHLGRNKLWTIIKNYPSPFLALYSPVILIFELLAIAYSLIWLRQSDSLAGRVAALRELGSVVKKRQRVQSLGTITHRETLSRLAPVQSPLQVLRRYRHRRHVATGE
jgi:GT2 family glycosyltransferase